MLKSIKIYHFSDEIKNPVGIKIDVPEKGGLHLISGRNGTGKTTIVQLLETPGRKYPFGTSIKDEGGLLGGMHIDYIYDDGIICDIRRKEGLRDRFTYDSTLWGQQNANLPSFVLLSTDNTSRIHGFENGYEPSEKMIEDTNIDLNTYLQKLFVFDKKNVAAHKHARKGFGTSKYREIKEDGIKKANKFYFGKRSISQILLKLLQAKEGDFILIDELELGVHYNLHAELLYIIDEIIKNRKLRVIATTHSPFCFNNHNTTKRFLLIKDDVTGFISIKQGAALEANKEIGTGEQKELFIVEDSLYKLFVENEKGTGVRMLIGGGYENCLQIASDLRKQYPLDRFITILDPDIGIDEIVHNRLDFQDKNKTNFLDIKEKKSPEELLLQYLFKDDYKAMRSLCGVDKTTLDNALEELLGKFGKEDSTKTPLGDRKDKFSKIISNCSFIGVKSKDRKFFYKEILSKLSDLASKTNEQLEMIFVQQFLDELK